MRVGRNVNLGKKNLTRRLAVFIAFIMTFVIFANAMSPDKIYAASGTWKLNSSGWWYELSDGSYYQSSWAQID
ncbi:MAG: hypothetical protein K6E10_00310, partial [Eubacterium sp.]|nr:hypothetical protein [Eubacterium sp.]